MARARRLLLPGLVLTATLAGCAVDQSPDPSPRLTTERPSPTTSPASPAPSPARSEAPERPAAMARDDVEGAIAAAQYFLELYPYAYNTGDLTEWRAMSHPDCVFCASVIENVEELHRTGGYEIGGRLLFLRVSARNPLPGNEYYAVDFRIDQEPGMRFSSEGDGTEFEGGPSVARLALARENSSWRVREVTVTSEE